MATPKASGKQSKQSNKAVADIEPVSAEADFKALEPRLKKLARDQLDAPNVDVQEAATIALRVCRLFKNKEVRQRFANLKKSGEYDDSCVDDLPAVARAAWFARHKVLESTGTEMEARLPLAILDEAEALRRRMLKCAEYHLGDDPFESNLLAVIRSGQGYHDLANDLLGLSRVFTRRKADLAADKKNYRASDAGAAKKLGNTILELLGGSGSDDRRSWVEMQSRAWTLLLRVYGEVVRGGLFLYAREAPEVMFPSLVAAARSRASRPASETPEPPEASTGEAPGEK